MKKILLLLMFVLIVLGASGCQNNSNLTNQEQQSLLISQMKNKIGQIESLEGAYSANQATNLLKQIDGHTILLKSTKVNLNDNNFKDKMVEVSGIINVTPDGKSIMTVNSIDVLEQNKTMAMDVPNWIDYNSPDLGLNFKYRDDYKIKEEVGAVTLSKILVNVSSDLDKATASTGNVSTVNSDQNNLPTSQIKFEKVVGFNDIGSYLNIDLNNVSDLLAKGYTKSKIGIGYYTAYKAVIQTDNKIEYLFENNNTIIKISFDILNPAPNQTYTTQQNYFYDVLASLKVGTTKDQPNQPVNKTTSSTFNTFSKPAPQITNQKAAISQTTNQQVTTTNTNITKTLTLGDMSGYSQFQSNALNFSIYYPKSYYFTNGANSHTYQFGDKPIDEQPGDIILSIGGNLPNGTHVKIGNYDIIESTVNGGISYSYKAGSGKVYSISGPKAKQDILQKMIGSITES